MDEINVYMFFRSQIECNWLDLGVDNLGETLGKGFLYLVELSAVLIDKVKKILLLLVGCLPLCSAVIKIVECIRIHIHYVLILVLFCLFFVFFYLIFCFVFSFFLFQLYKFIWKNFPPYIVKISFFPLLLQKYHINEKRKIFQHRRNFSIPFFHFLKKIKPGFAVLKLAEIIYFIMREKDVLNALNMLQ